MQKYVVEFIGTFFLVFAIGNVVIAPGAGALAPIAIGAALMAMVFAGGHISGAHYNPAVTLALFLRGKCDAKDVGPYMVAQVLAAIVAGMVVLFLKGSNANILTIDLGGIVAKAFLVELLFTFALAFVVLNVATVRKTEANSFYGLAIGSTVMAGVFAVGGISGGVFNPAVAVGIAVMGLLNWANIWVYAIATFAGGAITAYAFKFVNEPD